MPLRKADVTATRKFEDGDAWMILRVGGLTKGEADRVRDLTASYKLDPGDVAGASVTQAASIEINNRVAQANRILFEILCVDWSIGEVSGEAYSQLDDESGEWVDGCIQQVLRERRERAEKNARSSKRPARRASSSAKAAS